MKKTSSLIQNLRNFIEQSISSFHCTTGFAIILIRVLTTSTLTKYYDSERSIPLCYLVIAFVAFRINCAISFGCDTSDAWLEGSEIVVAFIVSDSDTFRNLAATIVVVSDDSDRLFPSSNLKLSEYATSAVIPL
jgi:hypothetical protein